ncbi:hypothetical protein GCM10017557_50540 [Streptomyces aurantiacus]|uniref:Uncharacterized protein n=1 Tax=Streptomyces aurantiacus TaxID=47760 RepID=A0A7G1PAR5_9ACTN|nr:hypothetical protein GCM10017557_50540 [Streptomyces aurantiacus]
MRWEFLGCGYWCVGVGAGRWGLVAQFPAPLKDCAVPRAPEGPRRSPRPRRTAPFPAPLKGLRHSPRSPKDCAVSRAPKRLRSLVRGDLTVQSVKKVVPLLYICGT